MLEAPETTEVSLPPVLEQVGALGSLLVHDMANHMCIISGNAGVAQMLMDDPEQCARALDAIVKASEKISHLLARSGELRRRMVEELARGDAETALDQVRSVIARHGQWSVDVVGSLRGPLMLPTSWVAFGVQQILSEVGSVPGELRISKMKPAADTAFIPAGGCYLELRFRWRSTTRLSMDDVRTRYENIGLMATFELVRQCGGRIEGFSPAPDHQEAIFLVPFAGLVV
jgi:hypothetical protein